MPDQLAVPQALGWGYGAARALQGRPRHLIDDRAVVLLHAARARVT